MGGELYFTESHCSALQKIRFDKVHKTNLFKGGGGENPIDQYCLSSLSFQFEGGGLKKLLLPSPLLKESYCPITGYRFVKLVS